MHNNHSTFELNFHFVFVTKYRKAFNYLDQFNWISEVERSGEGNLHFVSIGFASNHVHLLVASDATNFNLASFVNRLKSNSSILFKNLYPFSWIGWQNGFFVSSVGKNSVKKVKKYLSNQS